MRKQYNFNQNWLFSSKKLELDAADDQFETITIPHTNKIFPHNNFDNQDYQFVSTYRKRFTFDSDWVSKKVILDFEGVMLSAAVYLNGMLLKEHLGGYMKFSVDISEELKDGENVLTVFVDSRERTDIPPYGHLVDYLTFGGIYRDITLNILNPTYIEHVFVKTSNVLENPQLECEVNLNRIEPGLKLAAVLHDSNGNEISICHAETTQDVNILDFDSLPEVNLWSVDSPVLYTMEFTLLNGEKVVDRVETRFGFREAEFRKDGGFYLNGERLNLFGLNRHQTYPYIGPAAPARLQQQDADILKYELACNIVRTSHYPQSPHFLNRCDEIGLLVFEELTGWQHIGDEGCKAVCMSELEEMIKRDRNHPSIILWGVRINESPDDDSFYSRTNALAHQLDPTRNTGGVRCFLGSSFLEDVYTYNDFSNTVVEPPVLPYLITEFAGHMFPTKSWDNEERLIQHALLHAKVHDLQLGNGKISGAIGWCAFDYATHIEFGSGDRICYHGVMDIYRLPKWAAYFYQSQQSPAKQIVLKAATHWTMGDRSGGGFNPLTIFSNCDEIEVIIGKESVGRIKPDSKTYPNLSHPPFTVHSLEKHSAWGRSAFYDLQVIGYIEGEKMAEQWIASNKVPKKLVLTTDTDTLTANGMDITRLIFKITDKYGTPLPYATKVVSFNVEGEADLIGENPFPLIGGQAAIYVKARHKTGNIFVTASAPGLDPAAVSLKIVSSPD